LYCPLARTGKGKKRSWWNSLKNTFYEGGIMKARVSICLIIWLCAVAMLQPAKLDQYQILAYKNKPAVVRVLSVVIVEFKYLSRNGEPLNGSVALGGTGTGFIFNHEGYIVTNGHVIDRVYWYENNPDVFINDAAPSLVLQIMKKENIANITQDLRDDWRRNRNFIITNSKTFKKVILSNGDMFDFEIKRYSQTIDAGGKDVGILKIEKSNLPVVSLGDSSKLELQEEIQVFGFPGAADLDGVMGFYLNPKSSLQVTITRGRISAKKQDYKGVPLIQTDAAIASGSSGGPAINGNGEVIGVSTYMAGEVDEFGSFRQTPGINFLIPINTIKEFIRDVGVEINKGSAFNSIYYQALDSLWKEDWYAASRQVDDTLNLLNDSPDLKELKEKITIEINQMSPIKRLWYENKFAFIIGLLIVILVVVFVLMALKSRAKAAAPSAERMPAERAKAPVMDTKESEMRPDKTVLLNGTIDILINDQKIESHTIADKPVTIGRDPAQATVLIQDPIVSKLHCTFFAKQGGVFVRDNGSTNGLYIADRKIDEQVLQDGDLISIGRKGTIKIAFHK
jgi:hypothetical protein